MPRKTKEVDEKKATVKVQKSNKEEAKLKKVEEVKKVTKKADKKVSAKKSPAKKPKTSTSSASNKTAKKTKEATVSHSKKTDKELKTSTVSLSNKSAKKAKTSTVSASNKTDKKSKSSTASVSKSKASATSVSDKADKKLKTTSLTSKAQNDSKAEKKETVKTQKKAGTSKNDKKEKAPKATKTAKTKQLKDTSSKKTSKQSKAVSSKKPSKQSNIVFSPEYYDLPFKYNQTVVKILAQTPTNLFIYWEISDEDRENLKNQYGQYFFEITKPVLIVHNITLNYSFEVDIDDFANSWYLHVNDSNSEYKIELGRRPIPINYSYMPEYNIEKEGPISPVQDSYIFISSSNELEAPNDKILFNKISKIYFRNIKTNEIIEKDIKDFPNIYKDGIFINIYKLYQELYKEEIKNDNFNLYNPSSGNISSGSYSSRFY